MTMTVRCRSLLLWVLTIWQLSASNGLKLPSSIFPAVSDPAWLTLCQALHRELAIALKDRTQQTLSRLRKHLQLAQYHTGRLLELELRAGSHRRGTKRNAAAASASVATDGENISTSQTMLGGREEEEQQQQQQQEEPLLHMHRTQASHHEAAATSLLANLQQELENSSVSASARHFHRSATAITTVTNFGADGASAVSRQRDSSHYKARGAPSPTALQLLPQCLLARLDNSLYPSPAGLPSASTITRRPETEGVRYLQRNALRNSRPPVVSLLVQYFQRPWMLPALVGPFRRCTTAAEPGNASSSGGVGDSGSNDSGDGRGGDGGAGRQQQQRQRQGSIQMEMLINVDSRSDAAAVAEFAAGPLGAGLVVPVYSNNVHEIRSYNRLARLARGKILIMLQDDDVFPLDTVCDWLSSLVRAFRRWPRMGAIGSQRFVFDYHPNTSKYGVHFWDPGAGGIGDIGGGDGERPPPPPLRMQFVTLVDYAPIAVRRSAFLKLGGIDENMSESGACGVHSDYDLALRMWLAGWQVSYIEMPGLNKDPQEPEGGTHRRGVFGYCWERQWELAIGYMDQRWGHHCRWEPSAFYWFGSNVMEVVAEHVRQLNLRLLRPIVEPSEVGYICPFGYGCGEMPYDNITGVPGPVQPPFGNLTTWPKHVWAPWLARRQGAAKRGRMVKAAVAVADRTA